MNKENVIRILKISIGSSVAIAIAEALGLDYAPTAGIITLLTLQNTKKATLRQAYTRIVSFFISILMLAVLLYFFKSHVLIYGIFMILMTTLTHRLGWHEVVSVNATVGGQAVLLEGGINLQFIIDEAIIVGIGIVIAIILNYKMPDKRKEIQEGIEYIDDSFRDILQSIALHLHKKEELISDRNHIGQLIDYIDEILDKALENKDNTLKEHSGYYIEYLLMRRKQCVTIINFYKIISNLDEVPDEADVIGELLLEISQEFRVRNNVTKWIKKLEEVNEIFVEQSLPKTREEFVTRAVLHQLINELDEFLEAKNEFVKNLTQEQIEMYG